MSGYFQDVWSGVTTVLEGMMVTLRHVFKPTITVQYPKETVPMYPRSRTMLVNDAKDCGFCLSCKRVCPANLFTITGIRGEAGDEGLGTLPDGKPKKMHIVEFKIDMSKCIYCGLCVDACDTGSLHWEQPQEQPVFSRRDLHKDFTDVSPEYRAQLEAREAAKKKAKAAEAAAAAAAKAAAAAAAPPPEAPKADTPPPAEK
ncbi:MAG TPA: 4Fe-4S binding protein [bacterium]|jgi:NADH-quinone oxidoreductase subunit I